MNMELIIILLSSFHAKIRWKPSYFPRDIKKDKMSIKILQSPTHDKNELTFSHAHLKQISITASVGI